MSDTASDAAFASAARVTWVSLLRTVRAPLMALALGGVGLVVPPQTADMLAALADGGSSPFATLMFHVALALLAFSAWYWSRALVAARFDMPDNRTARQDQQEVGRVAYDLVPRLMYVLAVLIGLAMLLRSGAWSNTGWLLLWAAPLGLLVYFRTALVRRLFLCLGLAPPEAREPRRGPGLRSHRGMCDWIHNLPARLRLLIRRAPWPNAVSGLFLALPLAIFAWGTFDAFMPDDDLRLPALAARAFPGPAVALAALALIIAPLSVLTFLVDGLDLSINFFGVRLLRRPPVVVVLVGWVLVAPTLVSLHTVRIVAPADGRLTPDKRQDLAAFFKTWVAACAGDAGPVRPIIVAVSGGASRAAIWGERVLYEVERATGPGGPRVFAVSSVSGGSVAGAAYTAALAAMSDAARCKDDKARRAQIEVLAERELSEDALGPLLAGALLVDIPRALFTPLPQIARAVTGYGDPRGGDRAEALERAFEHLWRRIAPRPDRAEPADFASPYLSLFYDGDKIRAGMPLWLANGTDVASGSRLVTVPFGTERDWPFVAAVDVLSTLNADVPISTAINNSARFPYLEPSGELRPYSAPGSAAPALGDRYQPGGTAREIIDGGYFDNEGLQTALDLADWLRREGRRVSGREVFPIVVQATADGDVIQGEAVVRCEPRRDNAAQIALSRRPLQLLAPIFGLYNVRGGHTAVLLRQARAALCSDAGASYQCDPPNGLPVRCAAGGEAQHQRFFHFYLAGNGDRPVPLNWVLSDATARFIWGPAMEQAGNPQEARTMHEALKPPK